MIRPDLADVDILRGVDEETPPKNEEPDEEDSRVQPRLIRSVEVCCCQSAEEYERHRHARCSDEKKGPPSPAIDVKRCPDVANDRERRPACI